MTRDHRIRRAVAGLKGDVRAATILTLLLRPKSIDGRVKRQVRKAKPSPLARFKPNPKLVSVAFRTSPENYLKLRDLAAKHNTSMTGLIEWWIGLGQL